MKFKTELVDNGEKKWINLFLHGEKDQEKDDAFFKFRAILKDAKFEQYVDWKNKGSKWLNNDETLLVIVTYVNRNKEREEEFYSFCENIELKEDEK